MYFENEIFKTEYRIFTIETTDRVELNITYLIRILSQGFSGSHPFCMHVDNIEIYSNQLKRMHETLAGETVILDEDSDCYIKIEFDANGKLILTGMLGGSHSNHMMTFCMEIDQSSLLPLRSALLEEI